MKRFVLIMVCFVVFATGGFAQGKHKGEKGVSSVGVIAGHAIESKTFTVGADYRYNIEDRIRLAPSVLYSVKKDYVSSLNINADVHYLARITDVVTIYPLGGLGVTIWNLDRGFIAEQFEDLFGIDSEKKTRIGLNLGFGGEMRVTKDIIVGAEFRYNLTTERGYNQAMLLARAAYYF